MQQCWNINIICIIIIILVCFWGFSLQFCIANFYLCMCIWYHWHVKIQKSVFSSRRCLTLKKSSHPHSLITTQDLWHLSRSSDAPTRHVPHSRTTFGKYAFFFAGPRVLNSLPVQVCLTACIYLNLQVSPWNSSLLLHFPALMGPRYNFWLSTCTAFRPWTNAGMISGYDIHTPTINRH